MVRSNVERLWYGQLLISKMKLPPSLFLVELELLGNMAYLNGDLSGDCDRDLDRDSSCLPQSKRRRG